MNIIPQPINKILFYDIETVPCEENFDALNDDLAKEWARKYLKSDELQKSANASSSFIYNAALYPEFSKIVAISIGYFSCEEGSNTIQYHFRNFVGENEAMLLTDANKAFAKQLSAGWVLCGHNTNQFDRPFIAKRSFYLGVSCPFYSYGSKKPWEINDIDTMELTKFGSKAGSSLGVIAAWLGLPSPKAELNGREVGELWYSDDEQKYVKIGAYCGKDVLTVAKIVAIMKGYTLDNIKTD